MATIWVAAGAAMFAQQEIENTAHDRKPRNAEESPGVRRLTVARPGGAVELVEGSDHTNNEKEVVWESGHDESKSVLPSKPSTGEEWSTARVVLAKRTGARLAVLFELQWDKNDPATDTIFLGTSWFASKSQLIEWSGRIQLFRVFRRNEEGRWEIEFTAFPETLWMSVWDETAVEISVGQAGEYILRYAGTWFAERNPDRLESQRKQRLAQDGTTSRKLIYDSASELLLTELASGERVCVAESLWWPAEEALPVGVYDSGRARLSLVYAHQAAARHAGITLANNEMF